MVKNILFDKEKIRVQARKSEDTAPICSVSGKPMTKVICGSFNKKKMYAWFSPAGRLVLPIFKNGE